MRRFKQSRVVETGFLRGRRKEARSPNCEMSNATTMLALIEKDLLTTRFKYSTHNTATLGYTPSAHLPQETFQARKRAASVDLSTVAGASSDAPFITHSPASWARFHLQPHLVTHMVESDKLDEVEDIWLTGLLPNSQPLTIRQKQPHGAEPAPWRLVLGQCFATAGLS